MSKGRPDGGSSREKPSGTKGRASHGKLAIIVFEGGFFTIVREGKEASFLECSKDDDAAAFKGAGHGLPTSILETGR